MPPSPRPGFLRCSRRRRRRKRPHRVQQQPMHRLQCAHLLAHARAPVPPRVPPLTPTLRSLRPADTRLRRRTGRRNHQAQDVRPERREHPRGGKHPPGEVGFEAELVGVARRGFLAGGLPHDVCGVVEGAEIGIVGGSEEGGGSAVPGRGACCSSNVGHRGAAVE